MARSLNKVRFLPLGFLRSEGGAAALIFGVVSPVLVAMAAAAVAYGSLAFRATALQKASDSAALAAAKVLTLSTFDVNKVSETATNVALAALGREPGSASQTVSTTVSGDQRKVTVAISEPVTGPFQEILPLPASIGATSTAMAQGSDKVCVIGLDGAKTGTVSVGKTSSLSAQQCSIFSNSTDPGGLKTTESGSITAMRICTSGGYKGSSFSPAPITDCPQIKDPLAASPMPTAGACDYNNLSYKTGTVSLSPGTYCGGLDLNGNMQVSFGQGVYIIKGGTLHIDGGATANGDYVSFYLTGGAKLNFGPKSSISLSAAKSGILAGFLVAEDRSASSITHTIASNDARKLLGTLYFPNSTLHVGSTGSVADVSAYTVIVADQLQVDQAATLTLNVNYGATDVPVPGGVGPVAGTTSLIK